MRRWKKSMTLTNVLIDTNICLDAAQRRKPFYSNALRIIEISQFGNISGWIAAHSVDTIFYILKNNNSKKEVYTVLNGLRRAFKIAPVTQSIIDAALNLKWDDFEDAVHHEAARAVGCQAIITRNKTDFKDADLQVFSPQEFLDEINGQDT